MQPSEVQQCTMNEYSHGFIRNGRNMIQTRILPIVVQIMVMSSINIIHFLTCLRMILAIYYRRVYNSIKCE